MTSSSFTTEKIPERRKYKEEFVEKKVLYPLVFVRSVPL